ncbi:MAG: hypothetical protein RL563_1199 [Pseudomonadota bacterium]|jgi:putative two-component system response regulator
MNNAHTATILLVDDIPENITILSGMLRDLYRVIFATSGEEALEIVLVQNIDLILLDVMMPGMDGFEVCRRLKENILTREIPVIFLTALDEVHDETRGLELGAVDFLHKPTHSAIVRLRVQMHLERTNQRLALESLVQQRTNELTETRIEIIRRLGRAAEYRDNETGMHVIRMSKSAHLLALSAGVPEQQAELILHAAPMHDIGKIGIPDNILLKPGSLEPDEWQIMKMHPKIGAEIIGDHSSELLKLSKTIALSHHEKWDGSGYPMGLSGEKIPLEARIITITDVFDALMSERPYKKAWTLERALEFMQSQVNISFDPFLFGLFIQLVPEVIKIRQQFSD